MRLALLAAALALAAPAAHAFDVASLFQRLAKERPARAHFQEKKHLALLDRPLESSGELVFIPPDTLEKRTTAPKPERVTVDRNRITLERGGRKMSVALDGNPAAAILVESIRGTLAGDLASLTRTYSVALEGHEGAWRLKLKPLDPSLATLAERVEIAGSQARVKSVEIFQADGDRSVMTITPAAR